MIICGVQQNRLAGRRQPATRQQGVICCLQAPGTCCDCSRSGRPRVQQQKSHAHPRCWGGGGRKEAGIRLRLPCAIEKQKEKRQEPTGLKEAQALLGLDGERGSKQEIALAPGQTPSCQPIHQPGKTSSGLWEVMASGSLSSPDFSLCNITFSLLSPLSLCSCVFVLCFSLSLCLGFFYLLYLTGLLSPSVHLALFFSSPSISPNFKASLC